MSNSDLMMVNPNEIIIDMPVDEQNILQKIESMRANGIIQPITLWLNGMRVIDGFHRASAAQRLGWTEIPCYVVDCNEDAFWDARIQSARQHHSIANDRLATWIFESWKVTEWYTPFDGNRPEGLLFRPGQQSYMLMPLARQLWEVFRKDTGGDERLIDPAREQNNELVTWLDRKSKMWNLPVHEVARILLEKCGIIADTTRRSTAFVDSLAKKLDLTFEQRQRIVKETDGALFSRRLSHYEDVESWATEEAKKPNEDALSLVEFHQRRREAAQKKLNDNLVERSPFAQVEEHKRNILTVKEAAKRAAWSIESVAYLLSDTKEFSEPIAEAIASLTDFHNEHFKQRGTRMRARLAANNAKLRKEVELLTNEVASLKRALAAKQVATPRLRNVVVEHSS